MSFRVKPPASSLSAGMRAGCVAAALATTASPAAAGQPPLIDIPAQDARSALVQLCIVADCEVAFVTPPGAAARTRAVQGRMDWRQAVDVMLAGTDLRRRFVGARGVRVWRAPPTPSPQPVASPPDPAELAPVMVVGRVSEQYETALRRKRDADVIADVATASRIGELPAANLAEALQRVPGVAIEREVGEGQFVSVRGLGPLFQSVTLNGAPVAFNENIRNSTQSGRQFRFRALSADLLAGAQVTKSATPDQIEGGIGSNIDIETVGGLDGDPFVSLRLGAGLEARNDTARGDGAAAGRLVGASGTWGLVGGLSQEGRSVVYDRLQTQHYVALDLDGATVLAPSDIRTTVEQEDRLRRSAFVGFDWRPSEAFALDVDALASTFDNAIREDRLVYGLADRLDQPGAQVVVRDGVVVAGTVADGQIDNNTEFSDQAHLNLVLSVGARIAWRDWRVTPRVSGSRARSVLDTPLQRISAESPEGVGYVFDMADAVAARRAPVLTTDFDVRASDQLTPARFMVRAIESRDDDLTGLLDVERRLDVAGPLGRLSAFRLGVQFSDRGRDYQRRDREAVLRPGAVVDPGFYGGRTPGDVFDRLLGQGAGPWIAAEAGWFGQAYVIAGEVDGVSARPGDLTPKGADLQNSYTVGERTAAAYVRLDFERDLGGGALSGNAGLRLVETRTEVDGWILDAGPAPRPVAYDGRRQALLPSANLAIDLAGGGRLRLAASRTLTRPSLAELRAATVPASNLVSSIYNRGQAAIDDPSPGVVFSGVGGNPALRPYVSANLDLAYEWIRPGFAVSVAAFHKAIDDFIQQVAAPETLTFDTRAGTTVQLEVPISRPQNVGRAAVTGLELGLHRRLASGLGVWASATFADSRTAAGQALSGVSDVSWSVNPFYERGPLGISLSWTWRSAFLSEADMQGGGVSAFTVAPAGYLDGQVTLDLGAGAQLVLSGSNLTDTIDAAYEQDRGRLLQLGRAGRSAALSLRWRL